ncbi:Dam family site-specific DNA-(adenine-N6)-methyltransferase [Enterococcus faecalis]|uniref:DNA adenine methylase n=1 Tax=Enterococcus sp. AZ136 TaxID=2774788 RepID=UPI001572A2FF|nr:Dam family site-specific DNA-(adenine-N6)-methyltransferase [Enterococcus faecalis]
MKPILKYRGGKSKEIKYFKNLIPEYETYIEPFFGGGSVFFDQEPQNAIVNDINHSLIHFYNEIKSNYPVVRGELDLLQIEYENNRKIFTDRKVHSPKERVHDPNEDIYYKIRDMFNNKTKSTLSFGTIYYYINKTAYSGMIRYNKNGEFNVPYGRYANFNTKLLTESHHNLLLSTEILNGSYEKTFEKAGNNDFIFLDPPYDTIFSEYGNESFTGDFGEEEHRKLAQDFKNLGSKAMLVIGETPLITELYKPYIFDKYKKTYSVNIRNRFKSEANHLIITNYLQK